MVLADTRAQADTEEGKTGRQSMAELAFKDGASAIASIMLPKLLAPSTMEHRPEMVEQVRQMILQTPTAGIVVDLVAMAARPDSTDLLSTITCPTLVIVGEDDQATPIADSQYMAQPANSDVNIGNHSSGWAPFQFRTARCLQSGLEVFSGKVLLVDGLENRKGGSDLE
jgi:pimeloyl-ACP methyl ester carboxylesterase